MLHGHFADLPGVRVPKTCESIGAAGDDYPFIRTESHGFDAFVTMTKRSHLQSRRRLPQASDTIRATDTIQPSGHHPAPRWTEAGSAEPRLLEQGTNLLARRRVP